MVQKMTFMYRAIGHVDAGKTDPVGSDALHKTGSIRKMGRVDNKDAFLDTFALERASGTTIFSKQARLVLDENTEVFLLDTPGHVDFSAEMERTLQDPGSCDIGRKRSG